MARESTIQIYNSVAGATCPADLSLGELAFAGASGAGMLFIGKNGGGTAWIGAGILDEDDFASNSEFHLATQQSIRAYVLANTVTGVSASVTSLNGFTGAIEITAEHGITFYNVAGSPDKIVVKGMTASTSQIGVAKYSSDDFAVINGEVSFVNRFLFVRGDNLADGAGATLELGLTLGIFGSSTSGPITTVGKAASGTVNVNFQNPNASDSQKGVAKFIAADFDVSSGEVSLENTVVKSVQTNSGAVTTTGHVLGVSGGTAIETSGSGSTASIAVKQASTSQLGVASFNDAQFTVGTTGHVSLLGGADGAVLTVTGDAATGIKGARSGSDVTISGITASSSQMGVAKFDSGDFSVAAATGVVTLKNSGSDGAVLGIEGTANEVEATRSGATFTVGLPNDVIIAGGLTVGSNLIVSGNLEVNGTTTTVNTSTLQVEDPIIFLAQGNNATTVDIGFVGQQTAGGGSDVDQFTGLVRSDSVDSTFRYYLFEGLTSGSPGTVSAMNAAISDKTATLVAKINAGTF
jgi:hypothetical protein